HPELCEVCLRDQVKQPEPRELLPRTGKSLEPQPEGDTQHFEEAVTPHGLRRRGIAICLRQDLDRQVADLDVADEASRPEVLMANLKVLPAMRVVEPDQHVELMGAKPEPNLGDGQPLVLENAKRPRHLCRSAGMRHWTACRYRVAPRSDARPG